MVSYSGKELNFNSIRFTINLLNEIQFLNDKIANVFEMHRLWRNRQIYGLTFSGSTGFVNKLITMQTNDVNKYTKSAKYMKWKSLMYVGLVSVSPHFGFL